ncbi:cytochrome d ubiquinol oxidase subunit II [Streptomyces sp. SID13666]|uniref:cytochrome d ubiquinol oxidase subunit II n=1 Tax=unclassified Streptomyces TaxID=2593676 RepID=UPI0013C1FD3E|nr:cytochrome d ubiquinol oxidase subunit II [Streptomyces sp. SID13666]NEA71097.1 cytochrome d ubiquinol oxidase subunit II [Streptomyces sp. SID13588]
MDVFWYALVGLLLAGYLALESLDFGVGMLLPLAGTETDRARMRRTVVPLFLANEVWLVAFGGLLFGALPLLEGELLYALRQPLLAVLCAWFLRDAALWFRTAHPGTGWRRSWDIVVPAASLVLAAGWGAVLATLIRGLSTNGNGHAVATAGDLMHPFTLLCAGLTVAGSLRQGSLFAARSLPEGGTLRVRLGRLTRVLTPILILLLLVTGAVGAAATDAPVAVVTVAVLAVVGVYVSDRVQATGRTGVALLLGTAPLVVLPVMVGFSNGTTVLATRSGEGALTLSRAIADTASLTLLTATVLPALIAVLLGQLWIWRVFARVTRQPA